MNVTIQVEARGTLPPEEFSGPVTVIGTGEVEGREMQLSIAMVEGLLVIQARRIGADAVEHFLIDLPAVAAVVIRAGDPPAEDSGTVRVG
jgi:hypothetical protein